MKKDEIWKQIKEDRTEVYGEPMLDLFLKTTEGIEKRHYDELPEGKRKLLDPEIRLRRADTVAEADRAIKDGAKEETEALWGAASRGNLDIVKFFVHEKGVKQTEHALDLAARNGQIEVVKFLVENGAETLASALADAAQNGHLEVVKFLCGKGAKTLNPALQLAAMYGRLEVVKFLVDRLLERSPDTASAFNVLDRAAKSAAGFGNPKVAEFLKSKGAK